MLAACGGWNMADPEKKKDQDAAAKCWINVRTERYRGRLRWVIASRAHGTEEGYSVAYSIGEAEVIAATMARRLVHLAQAGEVDPRDTRDRAFEDRSKKGGRHE